MPNVKTRMTRVVRPTNNQGSIQAQPWKDLEDRTACFGEDIIRFVKRLPMNAVTEPIVRELVRAGTSVGAHYCEADITDSKKKFRKRISNCIKEARKSKYWLRMIATALPLMKREARIHWKEAEELKLRFAAIYRCKKNT